MEMVCTLVTQLTKGLTIEEIKKGGFDTYFVDHTLGVWPQAASGMPYETDMFAVKGDPIADLAEDMAADGAIV